MTPGLLPLGFDDFSDAHHLNGQGAEKFTAAFCTVVQAAESGQDPGEYFYDTLEEKTAAGAGRHLWFGLTPGNGMAK